jgi:subtilisin family serine protease
VAALDELAESIHDTVRAGAQIINLSVGVFRSSVHRQQRLDEALSYAARRSALVVVAAGNDRTIGSSAITGHPWVIPVVSCDSSAQPAPQSSLGASIGRRGVSAPGEGITGLAARHGSETLSGTSVAAAFVPGALALLWSEFRGASAGAIKAAILRTVSAAGV